jgi:tRNA-uridine 2-sulfurtransferase
VKNLKVAVGMSGGVDSSVTAALLKQQGYDVIGLTMKIWGGKHDFKDKKCHGCYSPGEEKEIAEAKRIAGILGIEHYAVDVIKDYQENVLDYFVSEYRSGRTPNPCLRCNARIKFDVLQKKAQSIGIEFDLFATGHYVKSEANPSTGRYYLRQGKDLKKDQSYFLAFLNQEQLKTALFPLGDYFKREVKEISLSLGLGLDSARESQDFMGGEYSALIGLQEPGPILDMSGNKIGEHKGIPSYTIGQRKGLGSFKGEPLYVIDIDPERNALVAGSRSDLYSGQLVAAGLNWMAIPSLEAPMEAEVKIRNSQARSKALLTPMPGDSLLVKFEQPQFAITAGQAAVFYDGDMVLGGGIIQRHPGQ